MLTQAQFLYAIEHAVPRFAANPPNAAQRNCIELAPDVPQMIVAGPGSGKTTVLVLRALSFVFVHQMMPEHIVITTFTKKAAAEIRSRLIEWGLALTDYLTANIPAGVPVNFVDWLDAIDINRFVTGTLDSICEEALQSFRHPNDPIPVLVEGFVGNAILGIHGISRLGIANDADFNAYIAQFSFDGAAPTSLGEKAGIARDVIERFLYDQVDLDSYRGDVTHTVARGQIVDCFEAYQTEMRNRSMLDFALMEQLFFDRLANGRLNRFTEGAHALLIDEYQDTNPLQESIYLLMLELTGASFTIVGDDDQALYRFRGSTVELFADFVARFQARLPGFPAPEMRYLVENYRSTPEIVRYFNDFIRYDPSFDGARVQPPKPQIVDQLPSNGIRVLGMFRADVRILSNDLTEFLCNVFRGPGVEVNINGVDHRIIHEPNEGELGDAVFLSHTVNEFAFRFGNNPPRERLPRLLRTDLEIRGEHVFNPRGRSLRDIPVVQQLLGLILECLDPPDAANPNGRIQRAETRWRSEARIYFDEWRQAARDFVNANPAPEVPHSLGDFVQAWQRRRPQTLANWPSEWPLLELCFTLVTWFPMLRDDPEGQVYLEAITRCMSQAATYSSYRSIIQTGAAPHADNSVRQILFNILTPIAVGQIDVDEDIMPNVPRSYLPIMTIHQAKGLEFPMVIVDVSSDYRINNSRQRFRRFPDGPSNTCLLEDDLADHCEIGPLRQLRTSHQRTFDDLNRLYYVAASRAESVLLYVGLTPCLRYDTTIKHVATGWRFDNSWAWRNDVPRPFPGFVNNCPLHLI